MKFVAKPEYLTRFVEPPIGEWLSSESLWELAFAVALRGAGHVQANPLVGAVAVDAQGRLLGAGWHACWGGKHAEVHLIEGIQERLGTEVLVGARVYSTLEPCAHEGKRSSCARFLAQLPLAKVYFAEVDPNPLVKGKGQKILQDAGIPCEHSLVPFDVALLTERSNKATCEQRPFVGLKAAVTLDGAFAPEDLQKTAITVSQALEYAHWLRLLYDGILVGAQTVIADNPRLDCRLDADAPDPIKVVLDPGARAFRHLCTLPEPKLLHLQPARTVWVASPAAWADPVLQYQLDHLKAQGLQTLSVPPRGRTGFDLDRLLLHLQEQGISSLLLEGGSGVWASFLSQALVDRVHLFQSPQIWGLQGACHWTQSLRLPQKMRLQDVRMVNLDPDWALEARILKKTLRDECHHLGVSGLGFV